MPMVILNMFKVAIGMPLNFEPSCSRALTVQANATAKNTRANKKSATSESTRPQTKTKADTRVENTDISVNMPKYKSMAAVENTE
mmetsp:Transcript_41910/g.83360  ORF Transcript_41910/g.83360 Transcript_41910/m.83360 type:complete len:85 (-) Transcript_41910:68-322(-)